MGEISYSIFCVIFIYCAMMYALGKEPIGYWIDRLLDRLLDKPKEQEPSIAETIKLAGELGLPFPVEEELPAETLDRHLKEIVNEIAPPSKHPVLIKFFDSYGALTEDNIIHFSTGIARDAIKETWIRCECYICKNVDKVWDGTFVPLNELPAQIKEKESEYWEGLFAGEAASFYARGGHSEIRDGHGTVIREVTE